MIAWSKADDVNESVNKSMYSWFLRILQTDAASEKNANVTEHPVFQEGEKSPEWGECSKI